MSYFDRLEAVQVETELLPPALVPTLRPHRSPASLGCMWNHFMTRSLHYLLNSPLSTQGTRSLQVLKVVNASCCLCVFGVLRGEFKH